jgi:large subunit ribosomal protein L15
MMFQGSEHFQTPIHIVVSQASATAIAAIEKAGGSVTTRYYTPFSIKKILSGFTDPIHSRLFQATPVTQLAILGKKPFEYDLPDPTKRRDLEYYRDPAHRGYLSYLVPDGQGPSLFFRTPGTGIVNRRKTNAKKASATNKVW